ncbi:hypothetical protein [Pseudaestuariivita rosea]|uniref:hypothetical protein n=1 Tax=Pseudaestuariivita rosea TaxID=2763263 RepID=UPI001ABB6CA6|nr:hypothetical protein [Pseudaestuariivita rosea]
MDSLGIQKKADEIAALLEQKFRLRGRTLQQKAKRARRFLPSYLMREIKFLSDAAQLAENPKLMRMIDQAHVDRAFKSVKSYLNTIDEKQRRRTALLDVFSRIGIQLFLVALAAGVLLYWRGLI